jgi:hypothetical protein
MSRVPRAPCARSRLARWLAHQLGEMARSERLIARPEPAEGMRPNKVARFMVHVERDGSFVVRSHQPPSIVKDSALGRRRASQRRSNRGLRPAHGCARV